MKSDIEIARSIELKKIKQVAEGIGIPREEVENYGRYIAKIPEQLIDEEKVKKSNLILVTAITATKAGIGKTTVSIGLALGLNKIGKNAIVALREPSLGPCFGMKGGAAGGGYAQVLPMDKINLHFTGDFHAITSAHNMISALLDNYLYQNQAKGFGLKEILWRRVLDVNDRSLRSIIVGLGPKSNGITQESGFDITPASEIMAILCLSKDVSDLRRRIENILLGFTYDDQPFTVKDLGVAGAITVLLKDAIHPNLVQTTEGTAAFVHGGPFANIAHGCNSILATKLAMSFGDYVITEAGFGADLGAEKFYNIKCRKSGLQPRLTVIVATAQGLKMHGGVSLDRIKEPNMEGLKEGLRNLDRSLRSIIVGLGPKSNGITQESGFDITPASEIMAILCLSKDVSDLRRRIENILLGFTYDDQPFTVKDLGVAGAITVLLKDAIHPNLVQTTEGTAAFVHGGPFANIAHGCNSILATKLAMSFGDYVITEAGFGADLGAEKFYNIKCRKSGLQPRLTVIVATAQGLKMHGGVSLDRIKEPNMEGLKEGLRNLDKHVRNLRSFGQTIIVAFNKFASDTDEEMELLREHCEQLGVGFAINNAFSEGGEGAVDMARLVVDTIENNPSESLRYTYKEEDSIQQKIEKVATNIYGASVITYSSIARNRIKLIEKMGITHYPVCIAKTQYSFSADPKIYGAVNNFEFHIKDIVINNGAEMIVAIAGEILRMPGLPKEPQALHIDIVDGEIEGLS